jgi:oligopeptide/dipeptide ABC transporter ATP-binding protein
LRGSALRERLLELLCDVDLKPPEDYIERYPHELSGGEKQRVVIARAVALRPRLVIADEPVSSLDMSIRGKVLNLLRELQSKYGISYLLITHDLRVLRVMSNRIAIMYLGKITEMARAKDLFARPCHPYTRGMISAELIPDPRSIKERKQFILAGEVPSPIDPPSGCRFHTRCQYKKSVCSAEEPELVKVGEDHVVACHFWEEIAAQPM